MTSLKTLPHAVLAVLALAAAAACGEAPAPEADTEEAAPAAAAEMSASPSVAITAPEPGATVDGPAVTVHLEAHGVTIVPAGDTTAGTGHHHLYLDEDLTPAGVPVPKIPGRVIHLGDGSSEFTFEDVSPGEHRLIAVLADGLHVPLQPWVVDTVRFTVR